MHAHRIHRSLHRGVVSLPSSSSSNSTAQARTRSGNRTFSSVSNIARKQEHKTQYYVATLPWSVKDEDRKERFNSLVKNARLTENDKIGED